jgi:abhydrolase domain-containing protein 14
MTLHSQFAEVGDCRIHYLEMGDPDASIAILLLHGSSFSAQTWQDLGTIELLARRGYRVVAIDLPGYGRSAPPSGNPADFLLVAMGALNLDRPIVVSPSMSGCYSLPVVAKHSEQLRGFVAVAPIAIGSYQRSLRGVMLPTLAIWGSEDRSVSPSQADLLCQLMPNARKVILPNAGHACYMKATEEFHEQLIQAIEVFFLDRS